MTEKLRVLLVDDRPDRARHLARDLEQAGCLVVAQLTGPVDLHATLRGVQPDVVVIDMDSPSRDTLEDMHRIHREQPRPIVMFVDDGDTESMRTAVRAGVAAYVVKGATPERIRPLLELACARFETFQSLRDELERAQSSLAERKLIEKAKGVLMETRGQSEQEAFSSMRKLAMDQGKRIVDVARAVLSAAELLAPEASAGRPPRGGRT